MGNTVIMQYELVLQYLYIMSKNVIVLYYCCKLLKPLQMLFLIIILWCYDVRYVTQMHNNATNYHVLL